MRVAINGFGRIGRYTLKMMLKKGGMDIVAINDLTDTKTLAHLFKYDSIHGKFDGKVSYDATSLIINGKSIPVFAQKDPAQLPWASLNIDVVVESTGLFRTHEKASAHITAGAKRVIISSPADSDDIKSVVMGVNEHILDGSETVISNASCTTNNAAPMIKIVEELCDAQSGFITTVHSYTSDQRLHDSPHKDLRRARAAAENIIPTST
ncbi:MAG TPA: type I glyceraldehyde-3-phosphate dehydrogenase, partial [Bacteroidia bacterium]